MTGFMATAVGATRTQVLRGQTLTSVPKLLVAECLRLLHPCSLGAGSILPEDLFVVGGGFAGLGV